jgi:hypothetical protein
MHADNKTKRRGAENAEKRRVKKSLRRFAASAPLRFAPSELICVHLRFQNEFF